MTLNPYRLQEAIKRGGRVRGVDVPAGFDLAAMRAMQAHVVGLWDMAARAALKLVPLSTADMLADTAQQDVTRAVNQVYREHAGIEALQTRLSVVFDRGNAQHKAKFLSTMNRAMGTDVDPLLYDPAAQAKVRQGVEDSVSYIVTLDNEMKARLSKEIWHGIALGKDRAAVRKLLMGVRTVPRSRARLIARDQTAKLYSQLSRVRQEDLGITTYIWRTVGDDVVRPEHDALDNLEQRWDSPPSIGHPGDDIQCRCVADPDISTAKLI